MRPYLGCSISRFSNGDVTISMGPVDVKHGGGVTNHDSPIHEAVLMPYWEIP